MATSRTGKTVLEQLREPFAPELVKQRRGGGGKMLDYVPIETMLERLLTVAPDYNWDARVVSVVENTVVVDGDSTTNTTAVVEGCLTIDGKIAYGVGAMKNPDADMAVKSANSKAMKNAAKNGFGMGLELWNAEYRKSLASRRALANGSEAALKQAVFQLARERLEKDKPTAKEIGALFNIPPGELNEKDTLRRILEKEGLL